MTPVRAAVLHEHGQPPVLRDVDAPEPAAGELLVDVQAAPITPLDVLCATGTSYFGAPPLPYVPGVQGVGVVRGGSGLPVGTPVWFSTSAGMQPGDGSLSSVCAVPAQDAVPLTRDVDPLLVAALGLSAIASWMALTWRGELQAGEQVVVLGAGGVVGQVGVQLAQLLGARRVVAACRSDVAVARARSAGADEVVRLDTDDVDRLEQRLRDACDGPVDLVLDPLFGPAAAAATRVLGTHGRLVHLGSAASPVVTLDSAVLRSKSLRLLGYTNNELTSEQRATALGHLVGHAADGRLTVDFERVPLEGVSEAWQRQAEGSAERRLVVGLG